MAVVKSADIFRPRTMKYKLALTGLLGSLVKKRLQNVKIYVKGNRDDIAENGKGEIGGLEELLTTLSLIIQKKVAYSNRK